MTSAETVNGILTIPTIDITPFVEDHGDGEARAEARAAIARAVDEAARTVGFLQITGHGIPDAVRDAFTAATDAFFALGPEAKRAYICPPPINRGYSPPKSEALATSLGITTAADLFEAFNVGTTAAEYPGLDLPAEEYAANVHPAEVPSFEAAVGAWFAEAGRVARTMTRVFALALGLPEDYFGRYTDHSIDVLRMNNYRLPSVDAPLEPDQAGMGAHTDYGIVTVLWADQVPGLEILGSDGRWHPVQPADGALLVNLGDALARWTNDQWISTMHRVAPPRVGGELVPRRSAAYFHDGNADAVIECLDVCTGPSRPPRYEPVTVGAHLAAKLAGSRARVPNPHAAREAARLTAAPLATTPPR
ncbi:isopenicillin N synthase family oxygenase [Streptomyces sp. NBC_01537]|uniref:isopenicillin N synthase family dioxygenase n=1 Tax=Streptomyces sp. NBC_01537 TaxID=2903896 RepID=UPI00386AA839